MLQEQRSLCWLLLLVVGGITCGRPGALLAQDMAPAPAWILWQCPAIVTCEVTPCHAIASPISVPIAAFPTSEACWGGQHAANEAMQRAVGTHETSLVMLRAARGEKADTHYPPPTYVVG